MSHIKNSGLTFAKSFCMEAGADIFSLEPWQASETVRNFWRIFSSLISAPRFASTYLAFVQEN